MSTQYVTASARRKEDLAREEFLKLFSAPQIKKSEPRGILSIYPVRMAGAPKQTELFFAVWKLGDQVLVFRIELPITRSKDNKRRIQKAFKRYFGPCIHIKGWAALCAYSKAEQWHDITDLRQLAEAKP